MRSARLIHQTDYDDLYSQALRHILPVAKLEMDGISLIVKYSLDNPDIIMTCDDNGKIYLLNSLTKLRSKIPDYPERVKPLKKFILSDSPIFDADWHNNSKQLLIASGDLSCSLVDVEKGVKILSNQPHTNSVRAIKSCPYNPNLFASGGRDGNLFLWDIRKSNSQHINIMCTQIDSCQPELQSYIGVQFYNDEMTLITAQANEENIKVWDLRKLSNWDHYKQNFKSKQIQENPLIFFKLNKNSAQMSKMIEMFQDIQLMKSQMLQQINKSQLDLIESNLKQMLSSHNERKLLQDNTIVKGYTSLAISATQKYLLANTIDHILTLYKTDQFDYSEPQLFTGHKSNYYIRSIISPCEKYILSGSKDSSIYIWQINQKQKSFRQDLIDTKKQMCQPLVCLGTAHLGEVNGVDWGKNNTNFIASVGDDKMLYIWDFVNSAGLDQY